METLTLSTLLPAFALTLLAGLATALGALLTFISKENNLKFLSIGLGFSAGVMIYLSFMEILVESQNAFAASYTPFIGEVLAIVAFFTGIGLTFIIDQLVPDHINPHHALEYNEVHHSNESYAALSRIGIFTAVALAIHNFPEGFATFSMALEDVHAGSAIAVAIAIHNIPEGLAVALPVYYATKNRGKAFLYAFLSGLSEPLGALIGYLLLIPLMGDLTLGITFGIVAGIMVYIAFDELLPAARRYGDDHMALIGVIMGMFVMSLSLLLFKL